MKKSDARCVMSCPAVSIMKDAIWRDAPGADKGLYPAGALGNKVPPLQSVGGDDLTDDMVAKRRVLLAI